jgi:hypothetical protein
MLPTMLKSKPKLTYANVAATMALVLSMSGGALAAGHYLVNSTKQINPKVLKALTGAKGATGATGTTGKEGTTGPAGTEGKQGSQGESGSALAYAHITEFAAIDEPNSKNFKGATITNPEEGVYCISGLGFTPHNVVASVDTRESTSPPSGVTATLGPYGVFCKSPSVQITVETWGSFEEEGFVFEEFVNLGVFLNVN